jgi:hypothetical protein
MICVLPPGSDCSISNLAIFGARWLIGLLRLLQINFDRSLDAVVNSIVLFQCSKFDFAGGAMGRKGERPA